MTGTENDERSEVLKRFERKLSWWQRPPFNNYRIPLLSLALFGLFSAKLFYPDLLNLKRSKTYRFKANALGFFVGDLALLETAPAPEAERKIVESFPENLRPKVASVIRPVLRLCEKHGVDPFWVLSVMWTESHFRLKATSNKGAEGLMQVMPETFAHLVNVIRTEGIRLESGKGEAYLAEEYPEAYRTLGAARLTEKLLNLEVGIFYLRQLHSEFDSNFFHATVAYNMGPHWTRERLKNGQPVAVKNQYLEKVMRAYRHITSNLSHNVNVSYIP